MVYGSDNLYDIGANVVRGVTSVGLNLVSVPLTLLPPTTRHRSRRAIAELAKATVAVPKEISHFSEKVVDRIYSTEGNEGPQVQDIREQARSFRDRLSRAADEFRASLSSASQKAGDTVDQAAAKVDDWVESKPAK
ncbi:MAG: hypothetical protein HC837_10390 [Chloroflexaceae bacterium]|nr:hypothetical protein [Chloroflexaceae bacterium]